MNSTEIRQSFLDFYAQRGHTLLPSASLVPVADPSLLLINAGMAPLKRYFLGLEPPPAARCANSQKCVRTIDIDQVGRTNRHNTFFEMLGKWSFGDYFKLQAMQYTLEWYTQLGLDHSRLYITHHEKDEESRCLWLKEMGWPESRLFALGDADNLWAAGDVGPWGYDTEYFWDFAPDGQPVDKARFELLGSQGRIVEIGNDVFMQFNRDDSGNVSELPSKNVDFGGGLERMCMVLQDKRTSFQTDCFDYLIRGFAEVVGGGSEDELFTLGADGFNPYWLAADHIRTATFLLGDGVTPGNKGRNFVVRRLVRRIVAQAYKLGVRRPFIMQLADLVIERLGGHYVELRQNRERFIEPWISKEEQQFFEVMDAGYGRLATKIEHAVESQQPIPGEFLFELYDTYGFPRDIAEEICAEQGVEVLGDAFEREMQAQRVRARGAGKFTAMEGSGELTPGIGELTPEGFAPPVIFTGYTETDTEASVVAIEDLADIRKAGALIVNGEEAIKGLRLTTDRTPFYSASGGQPDDTGWLITDEGSFPVQSGAKRGQHIVGPLNGELPNLEEGSTVILAVNTERRMALRRPHTTTHLMLRAMKLVLGTHISQAGSQLDEDVIRFDFSHFQAVTPDEQRHIEDLVNRWILEDQPVTWTEMPLVQAKEMGVTAVFDEKYGNVVRVVSVGDGDPDDVEGWTSRELCGGTHLDHTAQAGSFMVVKEESVQSGVRRIYALTGYKALAFARANRGVADRLGTHYKRPLPNPSSIALSDYAQQVDEWLAESFGKLEATEQELREAKQQAVEARRELALGALVPQLEVQASEAGGLHVLAAEVELGDRGDAKYLGERFAGGLWKDNYVVFIAANVDGKAALFAKVSPEAIARGVKAVDLIKLAASICGGGGGGRDDFAEAGGKDGSMVPEAAEAVWKKISELLSS
jgi:alanyl-tRNA synthetase